jgi:hypothetical protein
MDDRETKAVLQSRIRNNPELLSAYGLDAESAQFYHIGPLSWEQAKGYYRNGWGFPVSVDASTLDLTDVSRGKFSVSDGSYTRKVRFSFAWNEQSKVFGTLKLNLSDRPSRVTIQSNLFNFDYQEGGGTFRNFGTWLGDREVGRGAPYLIMFRGDTPHGK